MKTLLMILCLLLLSSPFVYSQAVNEAQKPFYEKGKADALAELKKGIFAIETFGLPGESTFEYRKILKKKYNIESRCVAGCMVDDQILGHAAGFNEIMEAEISKKWGKNLFDTAAHEAEKLFVLRNTHIPKVDFTDANLHDIATFVSIKVKELNPDLIEKDFKLDLQVSQKTLSKPFTFRAENIPLIDFLEEVAKQTGCLLDTVGPFPIIKEKVLPPTKSRDNGNPSK